MSNLRCYFILLCLVPTFLKAGEIEIWINQDGKKIEAAFLGIEDGNAKLEKEDGTTFLYPVGNLALDSQAKAVELNRQLEIRKEVEKIPPVYRKRRNMATRIEAIQAGGGEEGSDAAVCKAMDWLADQQNADGSFGNKYTVGATGMSCLAFFGHNETPDSPKYGQKMDEATLFLLDRAEKGDGLIFNGEKGHHTSYEHAIAAIALGELLGFRQGDGRTISRLETTVKKAIEIIIDGQTESGSWAYQYNLGGRDDMSLVGWQIQALMAAKRSGVEFRGLDRALEKSVRGITAMQDDQGAFKYSPVDAVGKTSLTPIGLYGLQMNTAVDLPEYAKGIVYLISKLKSPRASGDFYSSYYNVMALHHHGGDEWKAFHDAFVPKLLAAQEEDGSWDGSRTDDADGDVIQTAWGAMMLEVYYRYHHDTES